VKEYVKNNPYSSCRDIAKSLHLSKDKVHRILTKYLKLKKRYLKWIPHSLTETQKKQRVEFAVQLLDVLKKDERNNFQHILTGDESWLYYSNPFLWKWGEKEDKL
jgi:hypothetical protein